MNIITPQILTDFFNAYMTDLCPLLNPLDEEYSQTFIKFRSDVSVIHISKTFERMPQTITELEIILVPDDVTKFKFFQIENFFYHLFTNSSFIKDELTDKQFIIDLTFKKLTEYSFPGIQVKIYFIGDFVNLSFASHFNNSLTECNHIIRTNTGYWKNKKTSQLPIILSNRNTDPFDFFPYKNFFMMSKFPFNHLFNLNLLNFYVPKIYTINNFLNDKSPIFHDIRISKNNSPHDYEEFNESDYEEGYDDSSDDVPF